MKKFFAAMCAAGLIVTGCGGEKISAPVEVQQSQVFATITDDAVRTVSLATKQNLQAAVHSEAAT